MDLFAEQAIWPAVIATFREAYSALKAYGCSDEALVHEMWLSKEPVRLRYGRPAQPLIILLQMEIFEKCADDGFIRQLEYHSSVRQSGQGHVARLQSTADCAHVGRPEVLPRMWARLAGIDQKRHQQGIEEEVSSGEFLALFPSEPEQTRNNGIVVDR